MPILTVQNLTKTYMVVNSDTTVLDHVSFTVEKGSFVAIIGASGSGKSTLLHLLGGVDRPSDGSVIVDGEDIFSLSEQELSRYRRQKVSVVYQFYNLLPMLNVRANVLLPLELDGRRPDERQFQSILRLLGMEEKEFYYPNQFSGGQQQRVAIARALMTEPKVLLADEPTGNLDSKNSNEIISLLRESNRRLNQTILLVTHDSRIAEQADRILEISDGKITFCNNDNSIHCLLLGSQSILDVQTHYP